MGLVVGFPTSGKPTGLLLQLDSLKILSPILLFISTNRRTNVRPNSTLVKKRPKQTESTKKIRTKLTTRITPTAALSSHSCLCNTICTTKGEITRKTTNAVPNKPDRKTTQAKIAIQYFFIISPFVICQGPSASLRRIDRTDVVQACHIQ